MLTSLRSARETRLTSTVACSNIPLRLTFGSTRSGPLAAATLQIDLAGQVNSIRLGNAKALLPLFEAVVNSIQSIEEAGIADGLIEVTIRRTGLLLQTDVTDNQFLPDIVDFEISDNGVGFTEKHFRSFETSFSTLKAPAGKGIGRLVWLKAFELADIGSQFAEGERWCDRRFRFQMTQRGIEGHSLDYVSDPPNSPRTVVRLRGFKPAYRDAAPKRADTIGRRIVEHCLVLYMLGTMPRVLIHDPAIGVQLDLGSLYREEVAQSSKARQFQVGEETFQIVDVLLRPSAEVQSAIHFCANRREVEARRLADVIAHAENSIRWEGAETRYAACVSGKLLDELVNPQRTGFNVDRESTLPFSGEHISMDQIEKAAIKAAAEFLNPFLQEAKARSAERVERFITEEEPRYRVLLKHRPEAVERLSGSLTDEKLEVELHNILASW